MAACDRRDRAPRDCDRMFRLRPLSERHPHEARQPGHRRKATGRDDARAGRIPEGTEGRREGGRRRAGLSEERELFAPRAGGRADPGRRRCGHRFRARRRETVRRARDRKHHPQDRPRQPVRTAELHPRSRRRTLGARSRPGLARPGTALFRRAAGVVHRKCRTNGGTRHPLRHACGRGRGWRHLD